MFRGKNVLLGVTGGIAAYKAAYLASLLKKAGADVHVVMTKNAMQFIAPLTFETLTNNPVATDTFVHDKSWNVEHVALAKAADVAIIAPATANIIGKMAGGIADDMLSTTYLALKCPVLIAPAMNTAMFENTVVQQNIARLKDFGCRIIQPGTGYLACGDTGTGRMAEPQELFEAAREALTEKKDMLGLRLLVTAGPTVEPIDPVRYITNRSSGKMGYALAKAAQLRGAEVILVSGPVSLPSPSGVNVIGVGSAEEMYNAVMEQRTGMDIIIKCAAVADYRPEHAENKKIKKAEGNLVLTLAPTKDILKELGRQKNGAFLVGFAAETDNLLEYAKKKLVEKNLDMIVANDVSGESIGFNSEWNAVTILKDDGCEVHLNAAPKDEIAERILDEIIEEKSKGFCTCTPK